MKTKLPNFRSEKMIKLSAQDFPPKREKGVGVQSGDYSDWKIRLKMVKITKQLCPIPLLWLKSKVFWEFPELFPHQLKPLWPML